MSFTQLLFLFGALAVAGPLIAHLLAKPRFRRLPFTMLRFLRVGQVESQSRRRFRDLLMLLLRCAIIVLIAMLFARPRLLTEPGGEKTRPVYYLGLDNSMSMAYSDGAGSYFGELIDSAVDYIRSADGEGLFNICALASGDWTKGLSKELALAEVNRLKIVPDSANIGNFLTVVGGARRKKHLDDEVSVLLVSDFTPNILKQFIDFEKPISVDNINYKPIISPRPVDNAAVIDAHVSRIADGKLLINVTVINYGQVEQSRQLTAKVGEKKSAGVDIKLPAGRRRIYPVLIDVDVDALQTDYSAFRDPAGGAEQFFLPAELSLSGSDGLKADDTFYLAVSVPRRKSVNVLLVESEKDETFLLKAAMNALSRMDSTDTVGVRQILYGHIAISDFDWADVIVCSAITKGLGRLAPDLENFAKAGGRIIFFMKDRPDAAPLKQLWAEGVLPARPGRCIRGLTYIQPRACSSRSPGTDNTAAKALANYRIDRIALTGYLECKQHADSVCAWRLQNGPGFVYVRRIGNGIAILVNTSTDDSLGSLTKSSAAIAFCRYLLGQNTQLGEHSFACDEQVILPASDMEVRFAEEKRFWVESSDGSKSRASVVDSSLVVPDPAGIGWVKTLTKPIRCAGINLSDGETDMTRPAGEAVANVINRAFTPQAGQGTAVAEVLSDKDYKPIWKIFAWIIIALLLVEPAVANRLKR